MEVPANLGWQQASKRARVCSCIAAGQPSLLELADDQIDSGVDQS